MPTKGVWQLNCDLFHKCAKIIQIHKYTLFKIA